MSVRMVVKATDAMRAAALACLHHEDTRRVSACFQPALLVRLETLCQVTNVLTEEEQDDSHSWCASRFDFIKKQRIDDIEERKRLRREYRLLSQSRAT